MLATHEPGLKSYWWWLARTPCAPFEHQDRHVFESCYIIPVRQLKRFGTSQDLATALVHGRLLTRSGIKKPRNPRPGEFLVYGNVLYSGSSTASVLRQQAKLLPIEKAARDVLRGARDRPAADINVAWKMLGLGCYSHESPLLLQLQRKGVVIRDIAGRLLVRPVRGSQLEYRAAPMAIGWRPVDEDWWDSGYPTEANGLLHLPWQAAVGWTTRGRPKGVKNKLPPIRRGRLDFSDKGDR